MVHVWYEFNWCIFDMKPILNFIFLFSGMTFSWSRKAYDKVLLALLVIISYLIQLDWTQIKFSVSHTRWHIFIIIGQELWEFQHRVSMLINWPFLLVKIFTDHLTWNWKTCFTFCKVFKLLQWTLVVHIINCF